MSLIKVDSLDFKYDDYILKDLSFEIERGVFVSLLGVNGAGKSTLLKNLNKTLSPSKGSIYIGGENLKSMSVRDLAKKEALVAQYNIPVSNTVFDNILIGRLPHMAAGASDRDYKLVEELIYKLNLENYALRNADTLSGGEYQKVVLARALAQEPSLILLDEPTSNLDIKNQLDVMDLVRDYCREKNISVLVSIHDINLALKYSDKFLLIKNGKVYDYGDISVINSKSIKDVYEIDVDLIEHNGKKLLVLN